MLIEANDVESPMWRRHELVGADAFDRARQVRYFGEPKWWHFTEDCIAIGIEDPRGQNAGALYRIQGAILTRLPARTLVVPWIPSQWRKAVGLPGNASKNDVAVYSQWQLLNTPPAEGRSEWRRHICMDWPQDAHDAHCIALATRQALIREEAA